MYLTITEFAKEVGISPSTLRLWDKEGKLKPHHISDGGKRFYSKEQVSMYNGINELDSLGSINGVSFENLSKEEMKNIIDNYEDKFNQLYKYSQGLIGVLKSIYSKS